MHGSNVISYFVLCTIVFVHAVEFPEQARSISSADNVNANDLMRGENYDVMDGYDEISGYDDIDGYDDMSQYSPMNSPVIAPVFVVQPPVLPQQTILPPPPLPSFQSLHPSDPNIGNKEAPPTPAPVLKNITGSLPEEAGEASPTPTKHAPTPVKIPPLTPPPAVIVGDELSDLIKYDKLVREKSERTAEDLKEDMQNITDQINEIESQVAEMRQQIEENAKKSQEESTVIEAADQNINRATQNISQLKNAITSVQSQLAPLLSQVDSYKDKFSQLEEAEKAQEEIYEENMRNRTESARKKQEEELQSSNIQMELVRKAKEERDLKERQKADAKALTSLHKLTEDELQKIHVQEMEILKNQPLTQCPSGLSTALPDQTLPDVIPTDQEILNPDGTPSPSIDCECNTCCACNNQL